jgi:hypothetical protein
MVHLFSWMNTFGGSSLDIYAMTTTKQPQRLPTMFNGLSGELSSAMA